MPNRCWRFESFELDREHRALLQDGRPVAVTPKAFDVLLLLVERHGQLVSRDEMLKALWPDSYVEEGNLSVQISVLRKRLGDNAEDHRFISTVPGRGYQFVAPVTEVTGTEARDEVCDAVPRPELVWRRAEPARRGWRRAFVAAASVLVAVTCTTWYRSSSTVSSGPPSETVRRDVSPEAKRLYQRGRYLLGKRTAEALRRGIAHFESALAHDPQFALAHTGLADAYSMLGYFGFAAPRDVLPLAQAAASKALELNPDSAAAQTSRAYIQHRYEWRFEEAERSFIRAITLEPDYALARHWYGSYLESMNRYEEAIEQSAKAEELEPISPVISANLAGILSSARDPTRAQAQWDKALELDEGFWPAHQALAEIYAGGTCRSRRSTPSVDRSRYPERIPSKSPRSRASTWRRAASPKPSGYERSSNRALVANGSRLPTSPVSMPRWGTETRGVSLAGAGARRPRSDDRLSGRVASLARTAARPAIRGAAAPCRPRSSVVQREGRRGWKMSAGSMLSSS